MLWNWVNWSVLRNNLVQEQHSWHFTVHDKIIISCLLQMAVFYFCFCFVLFFLLFCFCFWIPWRVLPKLLYKLVFKLAKCGLTCYVLNVIFFHEKSYFNRTPILDYKLWDDLQPAPRPILFNSLSKIEKTQVFF